MIFLVIASQIYAWKIQLDSAHFEEYEENVRNYLQIKLGPEKKMGRGTRTYRNFHQGCSAPLWLPLS